MILLDPDLEPDAAPKTTSVKRATVPVPVVPVPVRPSRTASGDVRLPSARTLSRFLAAAQQAVRLQGQVTVLLTTDAAIRKLNFQFRGKNKPTDVLSFPAEGVGARGVAGDLAISVTTAMGQAAEQGHSLSTEIKVLVLHGLLHLAGYDHETDDGEMARRERLLRSRLKLPQGLIERVGADDEGPGRKNAPARIPSGAKAPAYRGRTNVRAEARTLQELKSKGLQKPESKGPQKPKVKGLQKPESKGPQKLESKGPQKPKVKGLQKPKVKGVQSSKGRGLQSSKASAPQSPEASALRSSKVSPLQGLKAMGLQSSKHERLQSPKTKPRQSSRAKRT
jgi:probable rRNA maturation factor